MANEIDLWNDLEYCEKALRATKDDSPSQDAWILERERVVKQIKEQYPDLILSN